MINHQGGTTLPVSHFQVKFNTNSTIIREGQPYFWTSGRVNHNARRSTTRVIITTVVIIANIIVIIANIIVIIANIIVIVAIITDIINIETSFAV